LEFGFSTKRLNRAGERGSLELNDNVEGPRARELAAVVNN